jgi:SAM-dependent methyltransferase
MSYAQLTTADANPIKRLLQRRRLAYALREMRRLPADASPTILDYGGADGQLSRLISARWPRARIVCFEPAAHMAAEARGQLAGWTNIELVSESAALDGRQFDYCFCLEVLEHLPEPLVEQTLTRLESLLASGGTCVIGVPNEIHLSAVVNGLFRMYRRPGQFDAQPGNILRAAIGRPPVERPLREIAPGLPYHFFHTGFDYRRLRRALSACFHLVRIYGSPFPWAPLTLNSEVYFVVRRKGGC